jgi:riboflavin kinase/FMN adenylyltransferase
VTAEVIHGEKRGRALGFPTANLQLDPACGLKHGIYAVRVRAGGAIRDGVASHGRRPTFGDGAPLLEVFLFDFDGDLYGQEIDVAFIGWIRHEQKFAGIEALQRAIAADVAQARDALARAGEAFPALGEV